MARERAQRVPDNNPVQVGEGDTGRVRMKPGEVASLEGLAYVLTSKISGGEAVRLNRLVVLLVLSYCILDVILVGYLCLPRVI